MVSRGTPKAWTEEARRRQLQANRIERALAAMEPEEARYSSEPCKIVTKHGFFSKEVSWCITHEVEDDPGHAYGHGRIDTTD